MCKMKEPVIRFKGYTDDWEQRKLGDVGKEKLSNGIMNNQSDEPTEVKHINVINMYSPDRIHVDELTYSLYSDEDVEKCNVEYGDIFMTRSSLKPEGIAEANVLLDKGKYVYDDHLIRLKVDTSVYDPMFVKINLGNSLIKSQFIKKSKTTAFTTIGQDDIASCEGMFPRYDEQKQIGEFFIGIDNLIALHQRKCDELQKVKKYMLQKMFPKKGEKVPEIRFTGFTGDWEQRKLGELGNFKNGMNFSKDAMDKGYPFVNLQNIFGRNVVDIDNLGLAEASDTQLKEYNLQEGDVLFVRSSVKLEGVGEAAIVPKRLENTTYSGFVIRFRDESDMDINYKRFVFGINPIRNQIMAKATNSANKNISQDVLTNLEICVPSKEEQRKIGEYFANLDNLITLHQRKHETLKEIKKYMLQNMFPKK